MFNVNDSETLETIGRLITTARMEHGISQIAFAEKAGLTPKTLRKMETGAGFAQSTAQGKVEKGLGWRVGSIREIWEDRRNLTSEQVTLEEMRRGAGEPSFQDLENGRSSSPVSKASMLSDEELLAELSYRFRNYKVQLNGLLDGPTTHH